MMVILTVTASLTSPARCTEAGTGHRVTFSTVLALTLQVTVHAMSARRTSWWKK